MSKLNLKERLLGKTPAPNQDDRRRAVERDLINAESALGRTIFGQITPGHTREFFCLKRNVWIWHEDGVTIRYEVRENGVFKQIGKGKYNTITGVELENFRNATKAYLNLVKANLYK